MFPTRRHVDSDNSCLFSSIAYITDRKNFDETSKLKYRKLVTDFIEKEKKYDSTLLGMDKEKYIDKMLNPNSWGGAIELECFSKIFNIVITSIDIETLKMYNFGENMNYTNRCYIIYNGSHYDPLVFATDEDTKKDITIFKVSDYMPQIYFSELAQSYKKKGLYKNGEENVEYYCMQCNTILKGQSSIAKHGFDTKHWDFKIIN